MSNFVDAMLMEMMMNDPALAQAIFASRTGGGSRTNVNVAKSVKCPVCNLETAYSPAASSDHEVFRVEDRCSHQARIMFLSSHCVVCLEDQAGPPMVGLRCGHCVCVDDFKRLGGKMGDDAMMTPEQAAAYDAAHAPQDEEDDEDTEIDREQAFLQFQNMIQAFHSMGQAAAGGNPFLDGDEDDEEEEEDDEEENDDDDEDFDDLPPLIASDNRVVSTRAGPPAHDRDAEHVISDVDEDDEDDDEPPPLEPRRGAIIDDDSDDDDDGDSDGPPPLQPRARGANQQDDDDNSDSTGLPELLPRRQVDSDSDFSSNHEEQQGRRQTTNNDSDSDDDSSEPPPLLQRPNNHSHSSSDDEDDDDDDDDDKSEQTDPDMPGLKLQQDMSSSEEEGDEEGVGPNAAAGARTASAAAASRRKKQQYSGWKTNVEDDDDDDDDDDDIPDLIDRPIKNFNSGTRYDGGSDSNSSEDDDAPPPAVARRNDNNSDDSDDDVPDLLPRQNHDVDSEDDEGDSDDDENGSKDDDDAAAAPYRYFRIEEEKYKANQLKIGEIKKKLQEWGIDHRGMEKKELIEAYAKSVVDAEFSAAAKSSTEPATRSKNRRSKKKKSKSNKKKRASDAAANNSAAAPPQTASVPATAPPAPRPVDPFADLPSLVSSKPLPKNGMWVLSPNNANTTDLQYAVAQDGEIRFSESAPLQRFRKSSRLIPCRAGTRAYIYEPQPNPSLWHVKLKSALGGGSCPALQLYELPYDPAHAQLIANPSNHDVWVVTKSAILNDPNRKALIYVGFRDPTSPQQLLELGSPDVRLVSTDRTGLWMQVSHPQSTVGAALQSGLWYIWSPWTSSTNHTTPSATTTNSTTEGSMESQKKKNRMTYCGAMGALATPAVRDNAVWTLDPVSDNSNKSRLSYITIPEAGGGSLEKQEEGDGKRIVSITLDVAFSMVQALVASKDDDGVYLHYKHQNNWKLGFACLVKTYAKELVDCPRNSTLKATEGGGVWMWKKSSRSPDRSLSFIDFSAKDVGAVGGGGATTTTGASGAVVFVVDSTKKFRSGSMINEIV